MGEYPEYKIIETYHKNIFHSFDIGVATLLGVYPAIVFEYLRTNISKLKSTGLSKYKNRTWLMESVEASLQAIPYMNHGEFWESLDELSSHGMILICRLSDFVDTSEAENHSLRWYALKDECRLES